jgi:hypothetical protein
MFVVEKLASLVAITLVIFGIPYSGNASMEVDTARESSGGTVPAAQPPRVVMFRINGEEITVQDYVNFLQVNQSYVRLSMTPEGKAETVRAVVANVLLRDDIMQKGLLPRSEKATPTQLGEAYAKLAKEYFPLPPAPDEKAAYQFYLDHQSEFGIPEMVRISQIQFRVPEGANEEQKAAVKKRAEGALQRLETGESFAKLAGELTENPQAKLPQGDLGFLPSGKDPWLTKAIAGLKEGEHSKVVESPVGYEILMVTHISEGLVAPYANVREKVIQRMRADAQSKKRDAYIEKLARNADITIVQDELKPLFPNGIFPEAQQ